MGAGDRGGMAALNRTSCLQQKHVQNLQLAELSAG